MFTRVSSVFDRCAASPTTVGFGSHFCVLRKAVLAKTSLVRSRSRNGFTTDGFNDKGQHVLYVFEQVQQVKRVLEPARAGAPKTGELVRRLMSHPRPLTPSSGHLPAHNIPRLWLGEHVLPQTPNVFASGAPPSPFPRHAGTLVRRRPLFILPSGQGRSSPRFAARSKAFQRARPTLTADGLHKEGGAVPTRPRSVKPCKPRCRFANSWPEPLFRYLSNCRANSKFSKAA